MPQQPRGELVCWSTEQTIEFLDYCHRVDDPLTDLYEVIIYTGMRKGEALGLHWADVDLDSRLLYVHKHLATTVDIYGHLTRQAAQQAVDAIAEALDVDPSQPA
ncbi:tyrosine-type recombinase/integrase [Couchioplanes caeruleus]|uniref:tyrosine-type recombinase/integrase n=1 Tax=Couchioplanes caeruleus TaxID=56438 RepID=UPI001FD368AE|nr:tyrosine-type recombinase/integrase [Couchioplanes caeruleus]